MAETTEPEVQESTESTSLIAETPATPETSTDDETPYDGEDVQLATSKKTDDPATKDLILGKYKTQDDLVKAHQALEKKLGEKGQVVPEKYDLGEPMKALGWEPMDREANPDAYTNFEAKLKENGFSQKQTEFMFQVGKDIIAQQVAKLGPATNKAAEQAALKEEWGDGYEAKQVEASRWAVANLSADVLNKPLASTAAGFKMIYDLMAKSKGSSPITDSDRAPAFDKDAANVEINQMMKDPDYWKNTSAGQALQSKVRGMFAKMGK